MALDPKLEALLTEWWRLRDYLDREAERLKPLIDQELAIRKALPAVLWPGKTEGTQHFELPGGWDLKGSLALDRKIDEAVLPSVKEELAGMQVSTDAIIKWVPEVRVKEMRQLTDVQLRVFQKALIEKPKAPQLEVVPPKGK